jgi:hypothetical protein
MEEILPFLPWLIGGGLMVGLAGILASVHSTRIKIKHGYPLEGMWGQAVYPKTTSEDGERIKLLSQENAQLRAELGSIKDRLGNVERIVTDSGYSLTHQIEALRAQGKEVQ